MRSSAVRSSNCLGRTAPCGASMSRLRTAPLPGVAQRIAQILAGAERLDRSVERRAGSVGFLVRERAPGQVAVVLALEAADVFRLHDFIESRAVTLPVIELLEVAPAMMDAAKLPGSPDMKSAIHCSSVVLPVPFWPSRTLSPG